MKVTKKLLIAALLVMGITLIACNNGNGGSPGTGGGSSGGTGGSPGTGGGSSGGTGGGGSGTGGGSGNTTLPASKGADPFEGLELLVQYDSDQQRDEAHYKVDTEKKTIVMQRLIDDKWTDFVEYNYSYDSITTPTTITLKMTKIAPYGVTLTPIEELRGVEGMEYYLPLFSQLRTYTVDISNKTGQQATVTFEGQYNNNSPWYEQRAGCFYGTHVYEYGFDGVSTYGNMIHYQEDSFLITEVTASTIKCKSMEDNSSKEFPYTITGSGKQTQVTITIDGNTVVTCAWKADTLLNPTN